ncbi:MAG: dTDP-4-dehydrorhamnose reductase [Flavisolibacter sp.]
MKTILVTGSEGQLGKELQDLQAGYPGFNFVFVNRQALDVSDEASIQKSFRQYHPQYVINCAAYTAVDKAETEREKAMLINSQAVGLLAKACDAQGARFIHISTDYVFAGESKTPYREDDPIDPVNYYGQTKAEGEKQAFTNCKEAVVIRTSWVYSFHGNNFVKTMIRLMKERDELRVVDDQTGSPTYAADLAAAIMQIIQSEKWTPGIFHFSNEGVITWYEFAVAIRDLIASNCNVVPITTQDFPTPAKRPAYSVLNKEKICAAYGITLKDWRQSLQQCIAKFEIAS